MQMTAFQTVVDHLTQDETPRVWSLLISVFGDLSQDKGARISGSLLRHMTEMIGIKPEAMRVAIHRLRKDGWIESERQGRTSVYFLTARGLAQSTQASPRIYASDQAADQAWLAMTNPGQPAPEDDLPGVWIAPSLMITPVALDSRRFFVTRIDRDATLPLWMTSRICDDATVEMTERFASALDAIQPCLEAAPALSSLESATVRVLLVHGWRRIVLKTPMLPDYVFPANWRGSDCRARVADLLNRYPKQRLDVLEAAIATVP